MSNGKGKYKCTKEHKEWCKRQGKVAYYDKKENKCGCKPKEGERDAKGKVISTELIKK